MIRRVAVSLLLVVGCWAGPGAEAADPDLPGARQVVVRGRRDLADALQAAFGEPAELDTAALVLDVTPHVQAAREDLVAALRTLDGRAGLPRRWRIARLGERFSPAVAAPGRLAALVGPLLSRETPVQDTIGALEASLKTLEAPSGALVYLADWRFEDEHDLEDLVRSLARRQLRFGVVGSEAAFGRGWHDGVRELRERMLARGVPGKDDDRYDPAIGRRPYGPFDPKAPWHGGDSAAPHVPYRFASDLFQTEFSPGDLSFQAKDDAADLIGRVRGGNLEDLLDRVRRGEQTSHERTTSQSFPLPSAFGPQGLMRACAARGGRYVLWSWNPEHRVSIRYDHARCDRFGPDLRSRADVRKAQASDPAARAMLRAWDLLTQRRTAVVAHTAPLDRAGHRPQSIDLVEDGSSQWPVIWPERAMHRVFLEKARNWRAALEEAGAVLDRGLEQAGEPGTGPQARLWADARLFRHIVAVLAFEVGEALRAAETVPSDAWDDKETYPGLGSVTWIERGDDPDAIRTTGAPVFDAEGGERLKAARAEHLRRFRGTPFGLQVAGNPVDTWQVERLRKVDPSKSALPGRAPAESGNDTPPPPATPRAPGGGSSGGGPTTGR